MSSRVRPARRVGAGRKVEQLIGVSLLDVRQDMRQPTDVLALGHALNWPSGIEHSRRQRLERRFIALHGQGELREVVDALRAAGRLAGRLHRRQQQTDQDANDRDHDQQFDEREAGAAVAAGWMFGAGACADGAKERRGDGARGRRGDGATRKEGTAGLEDGLPGRLAWRLWSGL